MQADAVKIVEHLYNVVASLRLTAPEHFTVRQEFERAFEALSPKEQPKDAA